MEENKKSNILLLIVLFVVFISLIGIAVYFYFFDKDEEKKVLNDDYGLYTYKSNKSELKLIDNKYLIDYQSGKIMDLKLNTLYDGDEVFSFAVTGVDGNLYLVDNNDSFLDYQNYDDIVVYKYSDNKITKVMEYEFDEDAGKYPGFVIYQEDGNDYLYGVYDRIHSTIDSHKINLLDGTIVDLGENSLVSNILSLGVETAIFIDNKDYLVITNDAEYAIYDVKNKTNIVEFGKYSDINYHKNDTYKVTSNLKEGIIKYNGEVVLEPIYDFINDYIVIKDDQMALLSTDNKIISEFITREYADNNEMSYIDNLKVGNKYYIGDFNYDQRGKLYVFEMDGSYKYYDVNSYSVNEDYSWIYYENTLSIYDKDFKKLYDFKVDNLNDVFKYENCLVVEYYLSEDEAKVGTKFFDLKDGSEKSKFDSIIKNYGKYSLKVDTSNSMINIYENDKEVGSFSLSSSINILEEIDGNLYVLSIGYNGDYINSNYLSIIKKS